jgi:hypothetical protein
MFQLVTGKIFGVVLMKVDTENHCWSVPSIYGVYKMAQKLSQTE